MGLGVQSPHFAGTRKAEDFFQYVNIVVHPDDELTCWPDLTEPAAAITTVEYVVTGNLIVHREDELTCRPELTETTAATTTFVERVEGF